MLNNAKTLNGAKLRSRDRNSRSVKDFYFDDHRWAIHNLVADTGRRLLERPGLIAPSASTAVGGDTDHLAVDLPKAQIEGSPALADDRAVSRRFETAYHGHDEWDTHRGEAAKWGYSPPVVPLRTQWKEFIAGDERWHPYLRSTNDVSGYRIRASDEEIGYVDDFVIEDDTWAIRYLVVVTGNWWPGKKVLVSPPWIDHISWSDSTVFVDLSSDAIKTSPEYTGPSSLTRDYETRLHRHYHRQVYWVEEPAALEH